MELFIAFLRSTYYKRVATLQNRRERADDELKKLYEYRQALIEKNIAGVFSDAVFKEQNKLVEDKIHAVQISKEEDLITKYNLEAITKFIKEKLVDLAKTYRESDLEQTRVFVFSTFPSGLRWSYPGCSKQQISPFWSSIQAFEIDDVAIGSLDALPFEHLIGWLRRLMRLYGYVKVKNQGSTLFPVLLQ